MSAPDCSDPRCEMMREHNRRMKHALERAQADADAFKRELAELRKKHSALVERMPDE